MAELEQCKNCKYADYYVAYWWYPFLNPKCRINKKDISPEDSCRFFTKIGRYSR